MKFIQFLGLATIASSVLASPVSVSKRAFGPNLVANGDFETGDADTTGYGAVTIPGWLVTSGGTPTVVSYGTSGFPSSSTTGPSNRGNNFFAGGDAGVDVSISQTLNVAAAATNIDSNKVQYSFSAWLGGYSTQSDQAKIVATFLDANGKNLTASTIGPVTATQRGLVTKFLSQSATGTLPSGTRSVKLDVYSSIISAGTYTDGYVDNISFTISDTSVKPITLSPPANTNVPKFDHVYFIFMENSNYNQIIGASAAPYLTSLSQKYTTLVNHYALQHPSDPNYIAVTAGSTLGKTGDDNVAVSARNIIDSLEDKGLKWRVYNDNMPSVCFKGTSGEYWQDDAPFYYYNDVGGNATRCQNIVPMVPYMANDHKSSSTAPNYAFLSADDCDDMEGCGIADGDSWLENRLAPLLNSTVWAEGNSLLIISFDEDAGQSSRSSGDSQRVATILVSPKVKAGCQAKTRYNHYNLLSTVNAALGLEPLTKNDLWAQTIQECWA
ncbi:hypothetical protein INT43_004937 [Umbelopsis isabellina]|uniref:Acid phosphatase n=1 Tax=Mortierella isabellina TaxID=91625 RepID=A0A8H7PEE5_MORIS|nr:hypothetical protein INT43_004937 [Umbelopsis isabellina]